MEEEEEDIEESTQREKEFEELLSWGNEFDWIECIE